MLRNVSISDIFKLEYNWYEGEHDEILLGKKVERKEFENDLVEAKTFAESLIGVHTEGDYLGKGYNIECLPEYFKQIVWFLIEKKKYIPTEFDEDMNYSIEDDSNGSKIILTKFMKKIILKKIA